MVEHRYFDSLIICLILNLLYIIVFLISCFFFAIFMILGDHTNIEILGYWDMGCMTDWGVGLVKLTIDQYVPQRTTKPAYQLTGAHRQRVTCPLSVLPPSRPLQIRGFFLHQGQGRRHQGSGGGGGSQESPVLGTFFSGDLHPNYNETAQGETHSGRGSREGPLGRQPFSAPDGCNKTPH